MGSFRFRTRSEVAEDEALDLIAPFLACSSSSQSLSREVMRPLVARHRTRTWQDVAAAIEAVRRSARTLPHSVDVVWASMGRTPAEAARATPEAHAVRLLKTHAEEQNMRVRVEGHYKAGQEGVYVKFHDWPDEELLMACDPLGVWRVDLFVYSYFGLAAEEWLAALLWHRRRVGPRTFLRDRIARQSLSDVRSLLQQLEVLGFRYPMTR